MLTMVSGFSPSWWGEHGGGNSLLCCLQKQKAACSHLRGLGSRVGAGSGVSV